MADFKYEIIEELGVLSESAKGWTKELNRISWNGGAPKLDVRDWAPEHEKMVKGVTLTDEEAKSLLELFFCVILFQMKKHLIYFMYYLICNKK